MKSLKIKILILIILSLNFSCSNTKLTEKEIEDKAISIIERLNNSDVNIFREWNLGLRGQGEIWTKKNNDSTLYSCFYIKSEDTNTMMIFNDYLYSNEFYCSLEIDTSRFWRFIIKKSNEGKLKIIGIDHNGSDHVVSDNLNVDSIYITNNPFTKLDSLSALRNSLGVYGISHIARLGDFIQFYITNQDVLTYIPDYSTLNKKYKDWWIKEFSKGKEIKKNWNLRHLDKPRDNG